MTSFPKIWIYRYTLSSSTSQALRRGALLKIEFKDQSTGHADLHPWPEKGEAPLNTHLQKLKQKQWTSLSLQTQIIAQTEAIAQARGIHQLSGLSPPLSHYLILDIEQFHQADTLLSQGFRFFKVKLKHPLSQQIPKLLYWMQALPEVTWRVDFYEPINPVQWPDGERLFHQLLEQHNLDFIETPFKGGMIPSYVPLHTRNKLQQRYALDVWDHSQNQQHSLPVPVLVWKWARKSEQELFKKWNLSMNQKVVFTHSLAHPVDQIATAFFASRFYKTHPHAKQVCALVQKNIYQAHLFSLPDRGPVFPPLSGPGWGLNELFNRLPWKKWVS